MNNDIKNFFLAGLGSAAYTYEKATVLIDEFVKKGKLTLDEGKDLSEELKRNIKGTKETNTIKKDKKALTKEDMISLLSDMQFATKQDIENINKRLSNLETTHS
ncbi:phasin family protein [Clostridium psychrophilum]|uniref:phasin family protein n=1 Tax=Clostridium psychrophilum TaxID=132926 RepID=UPI001C0D1D74|nr:hypothetical protein [Clostridium psychrophilum]MBU3182215.1 hypothetical protein [Clostridium psychrophilum]